jgi:hypothetical protein
LGDAHEKTTCVLKLPEEVKGLLPIIPGREPPQYTPEPESRAMPETN